jgi:hypothetical protein
MTSSSPRLRLAQGERGLAHARARPSPPPSWPQPSRGRGAPAHGTVAAAEIIPPRAHGSVVHPRDSPENEHPV